MDKLKILLSIIIALTFYSCSTYKINYNRDRIIKKYFDNYTILIDNEIIQLKNIYLDKDNIKSIIVDKNSKVVNISQNKKNELFELKNLNLDSLSNIRRGWNKKKIKLIVLDGIPITDSLVEKIKIDPNSIKSFQIVTENTLNTKMNGRRFDGDLLVITTK